jgi:hypothetical protein
LLSKRCFKPLDPIILTDNRVEIKRFILTTLETLNTSLFAQVKGEVLFDTTLSDGAYRFYCLILYLSGKNTHCWYTQIELARFMGLKGKHADRSIRNYSKECEQAGVMRVERPGYHKANKYYPLVKVPPQGKELSTNKGELSTPNYPPLQDRGQDHAIDRNQTLANHMHQIIFN